MRSMDHTRSGYPRVVVTGMGALTPLGTLDAFWEGLQAGRSGIRRIQSFDPTPLEVQIAGEVDFDPAEFLNRKEARRMSRSSQMAQIAARMALAHAGLSPADLAPEADRVGVVMGCADAGFGLLVDTAHAYLAEGRTPMPTALVNGLPNMPAHYISMETGATGPLTTIVTACASGTQSIGAACDLIRYGRADVILAGGVDDLVRAEVIAGFEAMTVLATGGNDNPAAASRPFDADRNGFALGEGAAVLILESLEHARRRGAVIYTEVLGHASSSDAHHSAAPDTEGLGAQKAMRWALEDAHLAPDAIDYINAHGTATRVNDALETYAIKCVFGDHARRLAISSTKSMIGHCMGGSGSMEAIACILALHGGIIHPTINYHTPDPACDLDYVPNHAREARVRAALSNSFGLGGQNACLVLGAV
jgi:beta-ketoacyl-acyl-carrier-protein synthase II